MKLSNRKNRTVTLSSIVLLIWTTATSALDVNGSQSGTWTLSDSPYIVTGWVDVAAGQTLTIEAGVEVKFNAGQGLNIYGTLEAPGTVSDPIAFTSNGDQAADWWNGIYFMDGSDGTLSHCQLRFAGYWDDAAIIVRGNASPTIDHCEISQISGDGIRTFDSASPTATPNILFADLTGFGVNNFGTATVDARDNWWGDASGPLHETLNPGGTGFQVSDNVDFSPYLSAPPELWRETPQPALTWAVSVVDFSSQFEADRWAAFQALGEPDTYPKYGDIETAWASRTSDGQREFIELAYPEPLAIEGLHIYETYNPGAIERIDARDPQGNLHLLWLGGPEVLAHQARILEIRFPATAFQVKSVRLSLASPTVPGWNEIDAVGLLPAGAPGDWEGLEESTPPAPADIQVPADYATIQEAIDAAEAGQIIFVAPGLYEENIRLKEGVALTGAGAETTIIDGGGSDVVWGADDALISGFTLRNGGDSGVFAWNTSPTIQNCVITGSEQGIATAVDPLIRGNTITGNSGWGIFVGSSSSSEVAALPTISNNLIAGNLDATGIVLFEAGGIVVNNTIDGNGSTGIDLSASDLPTRIDLRNNIVTSNGWYGISAYPFDGELQTIGYNDVWNNGWGEYDEVEPGEGSIAADPLFVQPLTLPAAKRAGASSRDIGARSRANDDKVQSGPEPRAPRPAAKLAQSDTPGFDYHLQPASPCVDAGDLAASFQDLDGSRNDMGAYGGPLPLGASDAEQPEPDQTRPSPVGEGELVVTPAAPSPADEIAITVSGDFPQSNAAVESWNHSIEDSVVTINIATEWLGDAGATVITPWSLDEEIGPLSAGEYQLVVEVNGEAFLSSSLLVTEAALQESPISIDFDLAAGDQEQQIAGSAALGKSYELQLHITAAPEISGWSATIEYDPAQIRYASGSFQASSFIPGLLALADDKEGSVGVGGTVLGSGGQNSGDGLLGTLSFEVLEGFTGSTDLVITSLSFRRTDGEEDKRTVRFAATITSEVLVEGLTGDFDGNGKVDFNDFFLFADQFGKSVDVGSLYDLNPNGQVDFNDFFVFADHFGERRAKLIALARKLLGLPSSAVLLPNYPNPFNSTTLIPFQLVARERVQLRIYNLLGQQVRTLVDQVEQPGVHRASWDGRDDQGWQLTSGIYIYRLQTGDYADQRTMLLLR